MTRRLGAGCLFCSAKSPWQRFDTCRSNPGFLKSGRVAELKSVIKKNQVAVGNNLGVHVHVYPWRSGYPLITLL